MYLKYMVPFGEKGKTPASASARNFCIGMTIIEFPKRSANIATGAYIPIGIIGYVVYIPTLNEIGSKRKAERTSTK